MDVREVGRELGVSYALQGGVRRSADHLRVNAELVDTSMGAHLWAERYDRDAQVIRNGGDGRLQPVYFKESLKTFVATNDGLALHYINYSRSADLGNLSRRIAGGEVRKSQERQIEALRKRIEME